MKKKTLTKKYYFTILNKYLNLVESNYDATIHINFITEIMENNSYWIKKMHDKSSNFLKPLGLQYCSKLENKLLK